MIPLFQSSGAEPDSQALHMTFVNHSLQQMPPTLSSSDVMPQIPGARRERRREIALSTSSMVGGWTGILGVGIALPADSRSASGGETGQRLSWPS